MKKPKQKIKKFKTVVNKKDNIEVIINNACLFYADNSKLLYAFKQGLSMELNIKNPYELNNFGWRAAFLNGRSLKRKYKVEIKRLNIF